MMAETHSYAVRLNNLQICYGSGDRKTIALDGITIDISEGIITGLLGPDASGKTTMMRSIAGLLAPSRGEVLVFGIPAVEILQNRGDSIGYMPQRFGLYEDLTVLDNLNLYASLHGVADEKRKTLFARLLDFTSLAPFTGRLAGNLSGGMKQKLGIACALLGNPRLLLLDEPAVGVDPRSRKELWSMVVELSKDGMSVLWSTSYLDEAERCPQLIILESGKMLFSGEPEVLTSKAKGRVFLLKSETDGQEHRRELAYWTEKPGICDALIQGKYLRIVVASDAESKIYEDIKNRGGQPAEPRLEDAYLAEIGGIDKKPSPYEGLGHIGGQAYKDERVVADKLVKKFGDFIAVYDISFKVSAGEIVALLGPNGAGKSTTFRMLCGLSRPTSGACSVDGVDMLRSGSAARERLGYMAQKFSLYQDIKVRENILIFARLYGLNRQSLQNLVPRLAQALGLDKYLDSFTKTLPLGLKQRLALLCATMHEPPVLFLDEPTSGVDVRTRRDFWKHISALVADGAAALVTTHFMEEAEYCDKIALIYRGHMINYGSPDELKATVKNMANPTLEDAFIANIELYDKEHPL